MESETQNNDYFTNPDGINLFRLIYQPKESLKAVVFVCHGLFEHCQSEYYSTVIKPLNEIGCLVITHDHRGHGRSEGERGMIYDFDSLVRDVLLDIDDVIEKQKIGTNIPVFIYGHSMGGLITLCATLRRKNFFKGVCLEAPLIKFPAKVGKLTIMFGKLISHIYPTFEISKMDDSTISRDKEFVSKMKEDKLRIRGGVSVRTGMAMYHGLTSLNNSMDLIDTPFMIGHGNADEICEIDGSKLLMRLCPISDKTLIEYPNARHQLRNEINNVNIEFRDAMLNWVDFKINE